ncbi:unnamed protein product [Jaminaea pallidilutea]
MAISLAGRESDQSPTPQVHWQSKPSMTGPAKSDADRPTLSDLPTAASLSHRHADLDPSATPIFSSSDLLCSLLPNTLPSLAANLARYDAEISDELQDVVDAEYRDFIQLASRLAGERQRIDRLANWAAVEGQEGLEGARSHVSTERASVHKALTELQMLQAGKQATESRIGLLQLLLSFSDALYRLETMLGVRQSPLEALEASTQCGSFAGETKARTALRSDPTVATLFNDGFDEDELDVDRLAIQDVRGLAAEEFHVKRQVQDLTPPSSPGLQLSLWQAIQPSFKAMEAQNHTVDLPTKVMRYRTAWERLNFIRDAIVSGTESAKQHDFQVANEDNHESMSSSVDAMASKFLLAHAHRVSNITTLIKQDLRALVSKYTSPDSSLVPPFSSMNKEASHDGKDKDRDEKDAVPGHTDQSERHEQGRCLISVFETWVRISESPAIGLQELQNLLRQVCLRPWVTQCITSAGSASTEELTSREPQREPSYPAIKRTDPPLIRIYQSLAQAMRKLGGVMAVAEQFDHDYKLQQTSQGIVASSFQSLSIFECVVCPEILSLLSDKIGPQLFFVGNLETFHSNFEATQNFFDSLDKSAPSDRAARNWRMHQDFVGFNKRWQLSVYFQMRYREIVSDCESVIAKMTSTTLSHSASSASTALPILPVTAAAVSAFAAPWRSGSHLDPLIGRQWRLSLMVTARYYSWLRQHVAQAGAHTTSDASPATVTDTTKRIDPSEKAAKLTEGQMQDDQLLQSLPAFVADAQYFQREIMHLFSHEILPKVAAAVRSDPAGETPFATGMIKALQESFPFESVLESSMTDRLTAALKSRCAEPLRLIRSVSSTSYRPGASPSTASSSGIEPSYFIPQIFRPLRLFFGKGDRSLQDTFATPARLVEPALKGRWATLVIDDVAARYAASLTQMIQNYESLRRLKRGNASTGFGGLASSFLGRSHANVSVGDTKDAELTKMQEQMKVDFQSLAKEIIELEEVGVQVRFDEIKSWTQLKQVVDGNDFGVVQQ